MAKDGILYYAFVFHIKIYFTHADVLEGVAFLCNLTWALMIVLAPVRLSIKCIYFAI